jgi:formylglycine-generating enzyme required for sulfatase activity
MMGATKEQGDSAKKDEKPVHKVVLSDFYICKYEVTQSLWEDVMGSNPGRFFGDENSPVEKVSWFDCQKFIVKLNQITGKQYRLPTEAEWEYAARGGNRSEGYMFAGGNDASEVALYNLIDTLNIDYRLHVGTRASNELGLYDMSGNCYEFCEDNLVENPILNGSKNPIVRTTPKGFRIVRNTPFDSYVISVGDRNWCPCDRRQNGYGFRLAL